MLRGMSSYVLNLSPARSRGSYLERTTARMSTETLLMPAQKRRGFKLSARAPPALASITAGAGFTAADLAASPMPAIGQLAGKAAPEEKKKVTFGDVMKKASARAFRGGAAGFAAGVVQVGPRLDAPRLPRRSSAPGPP